jgi:predicted SAM-dependent methyltransferase
MDLKEFRQAGRAALWRVRRQPLGGARALAALPDRTDFHLGCGDLRLPGRVNVDLRWTRAVDVVADLNEPALRSARSVFSNAFFEHLYLEQRVPHLRAVRQALTPDGWVLYMGIPNFREVARLYLDGAPGLVSERFDLHHAYRFTHGNPEQAKGWWLAQLHKSLFDPDEVSAMLTEAGFAEWAIATYAYPGEPHAHNLGFYARREAGADIEDAARQAFEGFAEYVDLASLRLTAGN